MMLGVGGVAPPVVLRRAVGTNPNSFSLLFQGQTQRAHISFIPEPVQNYAHVIPRRTGSCLFALKKLEESSFDAILLEKEAYFDDDEFEGKDESFDGDFVDEFEDFDEDDEEEDDDDERDDDLDVPFHKMDEWLRRKPRGFGEGKVYDTSIEDKLLEEIEQSRNAQLANANKVKDKPKEAKTKEDLKKELQAPKGIPSGIRVRINNLPKKKNILRDLKSAFEGVSGIINISPVVSGNKKTRDPVCKGFGFVDFKSMKDAERFVQMFSGQSIGFGRVEKTIKCEILKARDVNNEGKEGNSHKNASESRFVASEDKGYEDSDVEEDSGLLTFLDDDDIDESDEDLDDEDVVDSFELSRKSEKGDDNDRESKTKLGARSLSSKPKEKTKTVRKKSSTKEKKDKIPKLSIPGSAKKLKVREKAKLADVFSRYSAQAALASKEA